MKIIITESQYERLFSKLPNSIRRRISENDFELIEGIIWDTANRYEDDEKMDPKSFVDTVIQDSIYEFIVNHKFDQDENSDETDEDHSKIYDIWWDIVPIIKNMYEYNLTLFYLTEIKKF
jgi:hypothetical protein